jgi:large subunit ribosomal protein L15
LLKNANNRLKLSKNIIIHYFILLRPKDRKIKRKVIKLARTKTKKFRGSMTHGKGKKAGRGAGLRGGKGNAGLLKHRYMHMVKNMPDHFGKHGFKRHPSIINKNKIINIGQLEDTFPGKNEIDLTKEGFDKLLGSGSINKKLKIKVNEASEKAIEKIKEKGGEIILPDIPKDKTVEGDQLEE